MEPVRLPDTARTAPARHAVIFANEDVLAVETFETGAVRIVVARAIVTLGFYVVPVLPHMRPLGFFRRRIALFSRYDARVVDDDEYQSRIGADDQSEEDEEKDQERNAGGWAASIP